MPRSHWKGYISFGLVSIPILLYSSENNAVKVSFHQMDKRDNARIKYQRVNSETGEIVPWEDIVKGYQYDKDVILPVDESEIKKVVGENAKTIAIENFINEDNIHFVDIYKTYYLLPDKHADKGYVILREALRKTKKIGIAKVIISTKEYVAAVSCYENALVLYLLHYAEEIKPLSDFDFPSENLKEYKVNNKELEVAAQLIKSMSTKWHPDKYKDEFQAAVHEWAENKIKKKGIKKMAPRVHHAKTSTGKIDFVQLLKKSLNQNKKPTSKVHAHKVSTNKKKATTHRRAMLH